MTKLGLDPVIDENARVLILGTLPGNESIRVQQYYANARNQFWPILARLFDEPECTSWEERVALMRRHRLGLWDVLRSARRMGSLDSAIREDMPNDLAGLLARHSLLTTLAFNGGKAGALFRKHKVAQGSLARLNLIHLPSTSPTPGRNVLSFEEKVTRWKVLVDLLSG